MMTCRYCGYTGDLRDFRKTPYTRECHKCHAQKERENYDPEKKRRYNLIKKLKKLRAK